MLSTTATERIAFPPFHLDLAAGRLSCDSKPVDLPPKVPEIPEEVFTRFPNPGNGIAWIH